MYLGNEEIKIAASAIIYESCVWKFFIEGLNKVCDEIYLKIDMDKSTEHFLEMLKLYPKIKRIEKFNNFKYIVYKEITLRMLDNIQPDIAVLLDHDEVFEDGILEDIYKFWKSDKKGMMFYYNPCISRDGHKLPIYPSLPHMKLIKWRQGLSFVPYMSQGRITQYFNKDVQWFSNIKINHYCMYTPEMEKLKKEEVLRRYRKF